MPEFRRGLGRCLPREAERDLFHPSLNDLRAEHVERLAGARHALTRTALDVRMALATGTLWLNC